MDLTHRKLVAHTAFQSRLIIICLQFIFNICVPDHNADAFRKPNFEDSSLADGLVQWFIGGLQNWDGQHYLHIAQFGYIYEMSLAFPPLFPIAIRVIANTLFWPLSLLLNYHNVLLLSAVALNVTAFIIAAVKLYDLTISMTRHTSMAYHVAVLFCFSPASIFFSATYTEALFACLAFTGMHMWAEGRRPMAATCFGLCSMCRSNGIVYAGFFLFGAVEGIWKDVITKQILPSIRSLQTLLIGFILAAATVAPFICFQAYAYYAFCLQRSLLTDSHKGLIALAKTGNHIMQGTPERPWCKKVIPFSYQFIQDHYWNVGFLRYYELKNIPNILLALPMIIICVGGLKQYTINSIRWIVKEVEFCPTKWQRHSLTSNWCKQQLPFMVHCVFLLMFCITSAYTNVTTRMMCSSSPAVFWFTATIWNTADPVSRNMKSRRLSKEKLHHSIKPEHFSWLRYLQYSSENMSQCIMQVYFISFILIGTLMFSNYLPWT